MKNKEEKKNRIWVPIVIGALACSAAVGTGIALVHNQQRPKAGTVATMSDAADFSGLTTEVAEVTTTEEATTEAAIEATVDGSTKPEAVPATTEIGGGKKRAEETTEEKKPSTTESAKPSTNHSNSGNSGSASSGQSTAPKPSNSGSNSGSSGNSGSGNSSGNNSSSSGNNNSNNGGSSNSGSSNSGNNTPQHRHNYNVWVKTKDAYDEKVIDQAAYDETIEHPEEGYWADAVQCRMCGQVFTSIDALAAHPCGGRNYGTADDVWVKTKDAWTETKHHDEKSHVVHHDEEGYWTCSCGARK